MSARSALYNKVIKGKQKQYNFKNEEMCKQGPEDIEKICYGEVSSVLLLMNDYISPSEKLGIDIDVFQSRLDRRTLGLQEIMFSTLRFLTSFDDVSLY